MNKILLTPAEMQSGSDRVDWAEGLIMQLPQTHDMRNSWLMNFGKKVEGRGLRENRGLHFNPSYQAICERMPDEVLEGTTVKNMYKIHGFKAANGESAGRRNDTFYETYEDALTRAKQCVTKDGCDIVIYKAIQVVSVEHQPIVITDLA